MLQQVNQAIQISAATLLVTCLLFLKHLRQGMHTWIGIGFTLSIIFYLIVESEMIQNSTFLFTIAVTGAITIPVWNAI